MIKVVSISEMREASIEARSKGQAVVLVPTMGYLHEGHRALLKKGRAEGGLLVMSLFVNPSQFGPAEDFASYPRDLDRDLKIASEEGVDFVFAPEAGEMYPPGFRTWVEVEKLSDRLCGASRPGHFRGVATVVLKLFNAVQPQKAVFGLKDFQQFRIIERMVRDLDIPVEILGVETVREPDGLAMSSRNSYLTPEERRVARAIPDSLRAAREAIGAGVRESLEIVEKVKKIIEREPLAVIEYVNICDGESLEDSEEVASGSVLFIAVRIGKARLIDNMKLVQ
ncbi:MAG: pantoate--beta-alanine ligase [Deltaproteobacteria bacterium]|nr:pantoate--beta-alanine ligase [Deltaproteobacteria bacterium]MBZ0220205.1 pantoate--beta-alanine ligase [Deltaproteobacteria bacterium]